MKQSSCESEKDSKIVKLIQPYQIALFSLSFFFDSFIASRAVLSNNSQKDAERLLDRHTSTTESSQVTSQIVRTDDNDECNLSQQQHFSQHSKEHNVQVSS